jgi:restriction endonuclease S subunit
MRDGWKEISLEDLETSGVIKLGRGDVISKKDMEADPGPNPVYSSAENKNGMIGKYTKFMFDEELITWSVDGGGHIFYRPKHKFSVTNIGGWLRILDNKVFSYQFLTYALQRLHKQHSFDWQHKAHPSVIRKLYTRIPLPPLSEQKRIVDLISSVDSYIEALQKQLESAKKSRNALVESQILELADSRLSSLKNLSTKIGSGATPRGGEEVYIETGVNLIRSQNVHDSNFVMRGLVAIEDSAAKALENVTVEDGDVLINITGASVTRCCVVDSTILPARVNQHVAIIRSDRAKILPKYLVLVLTSNEVKGFLNDIAGTGSTRQALTKTHLEDLEIPVPNISKQTEIIENSDTFDIAISKSQMALDGARILRSGLLNNLLSGEHEIPASYDKVIGAA